jgi:predicted phage terminase large subunit-like protein
LNQFNINSLQELHRAIEILQRKEQVEAARSSLVEYCKLQYDGYKDPPHIKLLAEKLEAVERGEIKRLAISLPPRHGKSALTSENFPAWYMGRNPSKYVIFATYAQELADDFGRKVRNQIRDEELYQKIFPGTFLSGDSQSARRFMLNDGGTYFAVGAGGPITGRGAHLLVIDDIIKGREDADSSAIRRQVIDWYKSVAYTRLMPGGAIIIIGTRWHEEDLIGWVIANSPHEQWDVVNLPAIAEEDDVLGREEGEALWKESYPVERLLEIKNTVGSREWSALFQQSPTAEDGNIFKREWWQWWDKSQPPDCEYVIQSYDTAFSIKTSADPTSIQTWGIFLKDDGPHAILLHRLNRRMEFPQLRSEAQQLYKDWKPDNVIIEKKASGQSLIQDLRRAGIPINEYSPDRDKVSRAHSVAPLVESGRVWIPKKAWAEDFINQLTSFPNGRNDDDVDAFTQAMIRLKSGWFLQHPEDPEEADYEVPTRKAYW